MGTALFQANTKKRLDKKAKEFTSGPMRQFMPKVIKSGYNETTKMWFVEYKYDSTE